MHDLKSALRAQAIAHITSVPFDNIAADDVIKTRFFSLFSPKPDQVLAFFWPMKGEPDTRLIANAWIAAGGVCALPCVRRDNVHGLTFKSWSPDTALIKTRFGTYEPFEGDALTPDIVLVPMLMADTHGNRLGRGAGHYDATLNHARPNHVVGVVYDWQVYDAALPIEPHDQRLDALITPTQSYRF